MDRLIAHHLASRIGEDFDGQVSGVTKSGLSRFASAYGADGFVPISDLGADYYVFDEAATGAVGERTGLGWRLGDKVRVKLADAFRWQVPCVSKWSRTGASCSRRARLPAWRQGQRHAQGAGTRPRGAGKDDDDERQDDPLHAGQDDGAKRPIWPAIRRGPAWQMPALRCRPAVRPLSQAVDHCAACGEDLSHQRADDLRPIWSSSLSATSPWAASC